MRSRTLLHLVLLCTLICVGCVMDKREAPNQVHNVAIVDISALSECKQGETIPITVSLANQGTERETFRVTLTEGISRKEIGRKELTLAKKCKDGAVNTAKDYQVFQVDTDETSTQGYDVWAKGDVNKDGYSDILISEACWNQFTGRVFFFYGGEDIDLSSPDMVFEGENVGDCFGHGYRPGVFGDINHDGFDDIVIGAHGYNNWAGRVYIFYGGPNIDHIWDIVIDGEDGASGRFGWGKDVVDIDKDGFNDLVIGAQGYDQRRGRVYIFWGGEKMDTRADLILEGEEFPEPNPFGTWPKPADNSPTRGTYFGRSLDAGGDINGDGYNDILVGARYAGGAKDNGSAYLFFGNTKKEMDSICDYTFRGKEARGQMGSSVELCDIDNDGFGDVIIGARFGRNGRGAVYIWWGSNDFDGDKPADLVLQGKVVKRNNMGGDTIICEDFNNDGYGDILVSAYNYPGYSIVHGGAYLFYGNRQGVMDAVCDHIIYPPKEDTKYFGFSVSAGDVNNDGYTDAFISAPGADPVNGKSFLYYGPFEDSTTVTFNWDTTNAAIGKHTIKVEIPPVPGEHNIENNVKTITIEVTEPTN